MKILIVDDHHLIRAGLQPVLAALGRPGEPLVVVEAATFAEARAEVAKDRDLDLVLLDLRLPDVSGFDALEELQWRCPEAPVVIMSGEDDPRHVRGALERGALGYIPKSSPPAVIRHALELVLSGGVYVPPEIMSADRPEAREPAVPRPLDGHGVRALGLTPRQGDVLALIVAGKSNKEICRALALSEGTVKTHVAAIFRALNVTTRVQAVLAAAKFGVKS
jgi:DNA-binding NarL/FixJ family response regulator